MKFLQFLYVGMNKCWPISPSDKNSTCQTFCTRETATIHVVMMAVQLSTLDHEHIVVTKFTCCLVLLTESSSSGKYSE